MSNDGTMRGGTSITLGISLDIEVYENYLDVGFARNFASSQAYAEKYHNNPRVIPSENVSGLKFKKVPGDVYEWLGFEAYDLIFGFLNEVAGDETLELDCLAYDLNEPDILSLLEKIGPRLRIVIDDFEGAPGRLRRNPRGTTSQTVGRRGQRDGGCISLACNTTRC